MVASRVPSRWRIDARRHAVKPVVLLKVLLHAAQVLRWRLEFLGRLALLHQVDHLLAGLVLPALVGLLLRSQRECAFLLVQKVLGHDSGNLLEVCEHLLTSVDWLLLAEGD